MNQKTKFKLVTLADFAELPHGHRNKAALAVKDAIYRSVHKGMPISHIDYDIKFKPRVVYADKPVEVAPIETQIEEIESPEIEIVSLDTLTRRIMKNSKDVLSKLCTDRNIVVTKDDTKATMTEYLLEADYLPEGLQLEEAETEFTDEEVDNSISDGTEEADPLS